MPFDPPDIPFMGPDIAELVAVGLAAVHLACRHGAAGPLVGQQ